MAEAEGSPGWGPEGARCRGRRGPGGRVVEARSVAVKGLGREGTQFRSLHRTTSGNPCTSICPCAPARSAVAATPVDAKRTKPHSCPCGDGVLRTKHASRAPNCWNANATSPSVEPKGMLPTHRVATSSRDGQDPGSKERDRGTGGGVRAARGRSDPCSRGAAVPAEGPASTGREGGEDGPPGSGPGEDVAIAGGIAWRVRALGAEETWLAHRRCGMTYRGGAGGTAGAASVLPARDA